jgi:Domain of unknown function (DUF4188)
MDARRSARTTHRHDGELVVFLIGMRFNRPWRPDLWLPTFLAMPRMLTELHIDPDSGLLGHRFAIEPGGPVLIQYWASLDQLYSYASHPAANHRPAWAEFNRRARKVPGAVGIWHETFVVEQAESVYVDMPVVGLARATASVPVGSAHDQARQRLTRVAARASHADAQVRPAPAA